MVESVADPDWRKGGVYTKYNFGSHTYLHSSIFTTTPRNDGAIAWSSPCHATSILINTICRVEVARNLFYSNELMKV